jgi:hypothetical protein
MLDFSDDVPLQFLHDGAPAQFSPGALRYLNREFPGRWIGRGGPIAWPPRSPGLNPLDFYSWVYLKPLVYSSPVDDVQTLRNQIVAGFQTIRYVPGIRDRRRVTMRRVHTSLAFPTSPTDKQTPWSESASELYRPSSRLLSAK